MPATDPAPARRPPSTSRAGRPSLLVWTVALAVVVVVVDQLTKAWAESALTGEPRVALVGDLLGLYLVYNPGAALSFGTGMTWILTVVVLVVVVVLVRMLRRIGSTTWAVALGLLLGGAVGNLIDRLTNDPGVGRGEVVDFIDYGVFVGNVADIAIVVAAVLVVWLALRGVSMDGSRAAGRPADEDEAAGPKAPAAGGPA
ncbi:signal peptidase II [Cellulomonas sp. PhB143]|uniref:signal peptidase II n=1 Tax=Cellulomonas sp. PhB143 TaxID=2485186 RepID=UPI000F499E2E|nr:signal peptidase II [Cellulomonas sp. PhB143]ROS77222.1 signal peptidase II [Cellulomonas sp. PhB143]